MRTISVINQKGGCGKTTVAVNLAAAFEELGHHVLLIDLDPQAHASMALNALAEDVDYTTYDLLMDPRLRLTDAVHSVSGDLDIIASSSILSAIEQELSGKPARESKLVSKLSRIPDLYDYVIIDSPPNVGLLTFNALMAATEVIIPIDPSYFSIQGLQKLRETLDLLERETQHKVVVHVLANNVEKYTTFSRDIIMELDRCHANVTLDTIISHSVKYKEAGLRGESIFKLGRADKLKREFLSLARELEGRVSNLTVENIADWMVKLHGPKRVEEGIMFVFDAPSAKEVFLTGEFTNWSREGIRMTQDGGDGFWKTTLGLEPGEYEYRFIVDGIWIKDPNNADSVLNEFGQENSLLIC